MIILFQFAFIGIQLLALREAKILDAARREIASEIDEKFYNAQMVIDSMNPGENDALSKIREVGRLVSQQCDLIDEFEKIRRRIRNLKILGNFCAVCVLALAVISFII